MIEERQGLAKRRDRIKVDKRGSKDGRWMEGTRYGGSNEDGHLLWPLSSRTV
jgi:hypothetical protein